MEKLLAYYREHDTMTDPKSMKHMVKDIPAVIETIVEYVQNILLHQHWSSAYGLKLTNERKKEPANRSFNEKLTFLGARGFSHVSEKRAHEDKMIAICRDFSVVTTALCREAGIPARARCGFASYFEKGKYMDHWVLEYWNSERCKWVMVDAQLDELQRNHLKIPFNVLDVNDTDFLTAPKAWLLCREGALNPDQFGIFQWWGYDYLRCNLILDVNSLVKMPMQPWDMWDGYKSLPMEEWTEKDYEVMDELAKHALAIDTDFQTFSDFVLENPKIKVPEDSSIRVYHPHW